MVLEKIEQTSCYTLAQPASCAEEAALITPGECAKAIFMCTPEPSVQKVHMSPSEAVSSSADSGVMHKGHFCGLAGNCEPNFDASAARSPAQQIGLPQRPQLCC